VLGTNCYFRNEWMNKKAALTLLKGWTKIPELLPLHWNTYEPVNKPFKINDLDGCAKSLLPMSEDCVRTSLLLKRRKSPQYWGDIELFRQARHNNVFLGLDKPFTDGDLTLHAFVRAFVKITNPDIAFVADANRCDEDRFEELGGPLSADEIMSDNCLTSPFIPSSSSKGTRYWYVPDMEATYGPHGFLWDIVWYNYFGPPYVDLIGRERLINAGWARVEEFAQGYECYATERIDDPSLFDRREQIRQSLHEFVWTPGCKREEKRAPVFDFSAQLAHAPPPPDDEEEESRTIIFAGLSEEEQQQAIAVLEEQTGKKFDKKTQSLRKRRNQ